MAAGVLLLDGEHTGDIISLSPGGLWDKLGMAQVLIRGLDENVVARLKARARANGRSLQAELRLILEAASGKSLADARKLADRIRRSLEGRVHSDSVELLREDRGR